MPAGELAPCVFCGEPILPGEETAGRGPIAAHARCADAALADDDHWEAIAAAGQETAPDEADAGGSTPAGAATRQAGCLGMVATTILASASLAILVLTLG
jgi:hypothetical protein